MNEITMKMQADQLIRMAPERSISTVIILTGCSTSMQR